MHHGKCPLEHMLVCVVESNLNHAVGFGYWSLFQIKNLVHAHAHTTSLSIEAGNKISS